MRKKGHLEGGGHQAWIGKCQRNVEENPRWVWGATGSGGEGRETGHKKRKAARVAGERERGASKHRFINL